MPATVTLDDLAALIGADRHGHRYETSTEGVLTVAPPPDAEHAKLASRLMAWLLRAGWPEEQVLQVPGIRVPGPKGEAGRIPDLTVWTRDPGDGVWLRLDSLLLVVEIISPGSEATDQFTKVVEYAAAGIPLYWTVARDTANTVTLHRLNAAGAYDVSAKVPLNWLLQTDANDHLTSDD
ncbi:Uma2 family endonuclease [Actinoplanes sp. NPDC023936]|uniref:Uma2 family endonuclease n=1 Tax=Actinoplanes sp. NPDC023936 TaxID=3154910 RepID=UPI00340E8570